MDPKISIVILNYNGVKYLRKTIPPILRLNYSNYEIIVVDNGSTDGSVKFIKKFKKIKIIENKKNMGYSIGKNMGVKNANGDYVLLLDNDILISEKNSLKKILAFQIKNENSIIALPLRDLNKKNIGYFGGFIYPTIDPVKRQMEITHITKQLVSFPNGGAFFINKKTWYSIGGFDEKQPFNLDDKDLGIRAYLLGFNVLLIDSLVLVHLGYKNKANLDTWSWRYKFYYSGMMRTIIKNFLFRNICVYAFNLTLYSIFKTLKNSIYNLSAKPLGSFIYSVTTFINDLPDTLKQRKIIQSRRIIQEDVFLKIKPPRFT